MTQTDQRKPLQPSRRQSPRWARLGIYAPFALLLTLAVFWSLGWFWLRGEVFRRMDAAARSWEDAGYRVDWSDRTVYGFPFRLDLVVRDARLRELSGWGLAAPRLEAEAFVFAPDHWIVVAPRGVVLHRRVGGPVAVGARVLRASVSDAGAHPPRVSVEGLGLTFATPAGARPFGLASAREFHLHTRAGPADQGAAYVEIDGATAAGSGLLGDIAGGAPLTFVADGLFTQAGAASGPGFAGVLRGWSAAGGALTLRRFSLEAGAARLDSQSGTLAIGADGRLAGSLAVKLAGVPRLLGALIADAPLQPEVARAAKAVLAAREVKNAATVTVDFQAGQTTLGPVAVGPSPRMF
ncbi:MAG TPA: DUF2125 domain-containing protein [Caulobacteraceae bacterium]|nr:DUF2125 domain-containing protein [Caulobacteraceae bacterium]